MTIKLQIEVADRDESGKYGWHQAVDHLATKGDGWRLPTNEELDLMYKRRAAISGFSSAWYWSSSDHHAGTAWCQNFNDGSQDSYYKSNALKVRAVRDVK